MADFGVGEYLALAGAAASAVSAVYTLSQPKPKVPDVVAQNPLADQTAIDTQAAQEAQAATLDQRRRARSNSLLSAYGGAGDPIDTSTTTTTAGAAVPKTTLGA